MTPDAVNLKDEEQETWIISYNGEGTWDYLVHGQGSESWVSAKLKWSIPYGKCVLSPIRAQTNEQVTTMDSSGISLNGWAGSSQSNPAYNAEAESNDISPASGDDLEIRFGFKPPRPGEEIDKNTFLLYASGPDVGLKANNPDFRYTIYVQDPKQREMLETQYIPLMKHVLMEQLNIFSHNYAKRRPRAETIYDRVFSATVTISSDELTSREISKDFSKETITPTANPQMFFKAHWSGTVNLKRAD